MDADAVLMVEYRKIIEVADPKKEIQAALDRRRGWEKTQKSDSHYFPETK
jgi:hypothetical protein